MASSLRLWLLGSWKARLNDAAPVALPTRQTRMLLARLVLAHPHPVAHRALLEDLCPALPPDLASQRLRSARYYLRRALGEHLRSDGDQIGLDPALEVACDVGAFEAGTAADATQAMLEAAVRIYRGPFLDPPPDGWAARTAQRLHARYIEALQRLIALADAADMQQIVLDAARRWVAEEPWELDTHRAVLRALIRLGDRAAAEEQLARAHSLLHAEWGAGQSSSLDDLAHAIARMRSDGHAPGRQPAASSSPAIYPAAPAPSWDPLFFSRQPLNGRAAELERLSAIWDQARQGRGQSVVIQGVSGIGKSRLAWELAARVQLRAGNLVLWSACSRFDDDQLLALLRNAASRLSGSTRAQVRQVCAGLNDQTWAALAAAIPELTRLLPERPPTADPRQAPAARLHEQRELLVAFVDALAACGPVLLVLEDGQHAHPETLALIREIAGARRLLAVVLRRVEEPAAGGPAAPDAGDWPAAIALAPLDDAAMRALIREALGEAPPPEVLDRLVRQSRGMPLFARDVLYTVEQQSLLQWHDQPDQLRGPADLALPESVAQMLAQRLMQLSPAALRLAQMLAVFGRPAGEPLIARLWDGPDDPLALQAELLERWVAVERNGLLSFDHAWLRERVLELIGDEARVEIHRAIAAALQGWPEAEPTELLHHYIGAHSWAAALNEALSSAARASGAGHMVALQRHLRSAEQAAAALGLAAHDPRRWDLLCLRERCNALSERGPLWQADLLALSELAEASRHPDWRIDALIRRGRALHETGRPADAVDLLGQAAVLADLHQIPALEALAQLNLADALGDQGATDRALAECAAAERIAATLGNGALRISAITHMAALRARTGQIEQAYSSLSDLLADPATRLHPIGATRSLITLGWIQLAARDYQSGLATLRESVRHAAVYGDQYGMLLGQARLCAALTMLGRYDESIPLGMASLPLARRLGDPRQLCALLCSLARAQLHRGDHAGASALAQEAADAIAGLSLPETLALCMGTRAAAALAAARLGDARAAVEQLEQDLPGAPEARFHHIAARVWLALRHTDQARAAALRAIEAASDLGPHALGAPEALWDAAEVLAAIDGPRAAAPIRERAYLLLVDDIARLSGPGARRALLEANPAHQALAGYAASGARRLVLLPLRDAPTGRALHHDELAPVVCTLAAPDDPPAGAERRRAQIRRLVDEAAAQGAAVTVDALASTLAVASRTIKRDLQELRQLGLDVATRRAVLRGRAAEPPRATRPRRHHAGAIPRARARHPLLKGARAIVCGCGAAALPPRHTHEKETPSPARGGGMGEGYPASEPRERQGARGTPPTMSP
ncbi:MAG: AAA family ATPase [Kouleothrix sp.]|nr:AAA family ATPase [Kouleothrix sp.]